MALINCPECNREISDKAKSCPHCGFPINVNNTYKIIINGYRDTDTAALAGLNQVFDLNLSYDQSVDIFNNCPYTITECESQEEANLYANKLMKWGINVEIVNPNGQSEYINNDIIYCPKCGSTNIQIVPRKWSLFTGLLTNKVDRVCIKCKYKF